jgi:hypothetical protein
MPSRTAAGAITTSETLPGGFLWHVGATATDRRGLPLTFLAIVQTLRNSGHTKGITTNDVHDFDAFSSPSP